MADKTRNAIRSFLQIRQADSRTFYIQEALDFYQNAFKNRIWYRGDGHEIEQMYQQIDVSRTKFWSARSTGGMEIKKCHTGLPGIIIDTLTSIVAEDLNEISTDDSKQELWDSIEKENGFKKLIGKAITDVLITGDGAFKVSFDPSISELPILEFVPGDKVEYVYNRGRIKEIVFRKEFIKGYNKYTLLEIYGYGYVTYDLQCDGKPVDIALLEETKDLTPVAFDKTFCMAEPFIVFESSKWQGRGQSILDKKVDAFDSLDEAWSQWLDALRKGRAKSYIPDDMLPHNPNTGEIMKPNPFDNTYISTDSQMSESQSKEIKLIQPTIPHDSYLVTYCTALDLCLQGLVSPSTIGIDGNKLNDNATAQREREKTTMYTRNKIIEALRTVVCNLVNTTLKAYSTKLTEGIEETEVTVNFGKYANPSFESQIETVSKGKQGGIMSIEAVVDELYGDTREEEWKKEEVARLKAEQGIAEMEEPAVNINLENDNNW